MTLSDNLIQQASARYHARYSDATYKIIQRAVIADLYESFDKPNWEEHFEMRLSQPTPNRLMNSITDAASEICQWPGFENKLIPLARELVLQQVSWVTIQLILEYLHRFEDAGDTGSADLCATVQVMQFILKAQPVLQEAAASAGDIHTSRGRAAHALLVAAEQLARTANLLVSGEGDPSYISEKIIHAVGCITSSQQEEPLNLLR